MRFVTSKTPLGRVHFLVKWCMNTPNHVEIYEYVVFIYLKTQNDVDIYEIYHVDRYELHENI